MTAQRIEARQGRNPKGFGAQHESRVGATAPMRPTDITTTPTTRREA